jgi:hypothetical protein
VPLSRVVRSQPKAKPKHAKPSAARPALAAGGLAAAFVVGDVVSATAASAATSGEFAALRQCESGGNYSINTGNGYYGAYQFSAGTWRSLGYSGLPHQASPATQDAAAAKLQASQGWRPWPGCARKLGLGSRTVSAPAPRPAAAPAPRPVAAPAPKAAPAPRAAAPAPARASRSRVAAPAAVGPVTRAYYTVGLVVAQEKGVQREEVRSWQARMVDRGWKLTVDGYFGPQSASVAARFTAEKRLAVATPGTLDATVYAAAYDLPVT